MPEEQQYIKMDWSLEDPEERINKVKEIISATPPEKLTPYYLEQMATYIIKPKKEKKQYDIFTKNRLKHIGEREISFEGLVGKLENGEDGIYGMIANDKNILFKPKKEITQEDLDSIEPLRELRKEIEKIEEQAKNARGRRAFSLNQQLIQMRKDQYEIKKAYKPIIYTSNPLKSAPKLDLYEKITIDDKGQVHSNGVINFYDEKHISAILCNYSKLKEDAWEKVQSDIKWFMEDFDALVDAAIKDKYPMYYDLIIYKIDGKQNAEIQELLYADYGIKHSVEYISSLWRNKIPKLIAEEASKEYLVWYYTNVEKGQWKKCGRCNCIKLANNYFFSKNSTSKDGYYSICKECRNKKK